MRLQWLGVWLVFLVFAGCLGNGAGPDGTPAEPMGPTNEGEPELGVLPDGSPVPHQMMYRDCADLTGVYPVPADAWRDSLPEGFELETLDPAGQVALEAHAAYECELEDGGTVAESWAFVLVVPPTKWENPDATIGHLLPIGSMSDRERSVSVYQAWGFNDTLEPGQIEFTFTQTPATSTAQVRAVGQESGIEYEQVGLGQGPPGEVGEGLARVFALQDSEVMSAMDVSWPAHEAVTVGQASRVIQGAGFPVPPVVWPGVAELHLADGHDFTLSLVSLEPL